MHRQIFVNLPIADTAKSKAFFSALGYSFDPDFTGDQGASLVLGNNLYAMLMVREFFATFTSKPIADAKTSIRGWVCLSSDSQGQVDTLVSKAVAAGGTAPREAKDHGFMYSNAFEELTRQPKLSSYDRLFPNQDTMPKGGFGNLIALPLRKAPREHGGSVFVDRDWHPARANRDVRVAVSSNPPPTGTRRRRRRRPC